MTIKRNKNWGTIKQIEDALLVLDDVFKKHNITYWLEAGALLGMCREKRILPWDGDADVSFPIELAPKVAGLSSEFKKRGYKLVSNLSMGLYKDGKHLVCIFPAKHVDDYIVKCYFKQHPLHPYIKSFSEMPTSSILTYFLRLNIDKRLIRGTWDMLYPLNYIKFKGHLLPIPYKCDEYLTHRFGDWHTVLKYGGAVERRPGVQYKRLKDAVVFPGKFDPIHIGHIMQIGKLLINEGCVVVDIFDYPNRTMSIKDVSNIIKFIFPSNVLIKTHNKTYGISIPKDKDKIYVMGNNKVANNLSEHGIGIRKIERFPGYRSSKMMEMFE